MEPGGRRDTAPRWRRYQAGGPQNISPRLGREGERCRSGLRVALARTSQETGPAELPPLLHCRSWAQGVLPRGCQWESHQHPAELPPPRHPQRFQSGARVALARTNRKVDPAELPPLLRRHRRAQGVLPRGRRWESQQRPAELPPPWRPRPLESLRRSGTCPSRLGVPVPSETCSLGTRLLQSGRKEG